MTRASPLVRTPVLRLLTRLAAGLGGLVGAVGAVSWAFEGWVRLTFGDGYVPMAPLTGLAITGLAVAILLETLPAPSPASRRVARLLEGAVAAVAVLVLTAGALGRDLGIERWMFPTDLDIGGVRVGRMSVFTAALLLSLALGRLLFRSRDRWRRTAVTLTLASLAGTLLVLEAYLLGGPLFYGSGAIPIAFLTALGIFLLGSASVLASGEDRWPLRLLSAGDRDPAPSGGSFWWLALVLAALVATSAWLWYRGERLRTEDRSTAMLETIARAVAERAAAFHAQRVTTARALAALAPFNRLLGPGAPRDSLVAWAATARSQLGFETVAILEVDGRVAALTPAIGDSDPAALSRRARELEAGAVPVVVEDRLDGDALHLDVWTRVTAPGDRARWLLLRSDPRPALTGMTRDLPLNSPSTEVLVYSREGEALRPLHPLRRAPEAVRALRIPLSPGSRVVGAQGALAGGGAFDGLDYAGVPVRGTVRPVPGTPWLVLAKVDRAELAAPVRRMAVRATLFTLVLILGIAAFIHSLWYRRGLASASRELALLRQRDASLEELRRSEDRYARAMRGASDGVWDWDVRTGVFYISPRWRELFGVMDEGPFTIENAFFERLHPADADRVRAAIDMHFATRVPYDLEARLRDDAGRYHWLWIRGEADRDDQGQVQRMAGSVTDVTARREAEDRVRRLDRVRRVRSAASRAVARARGETELVQAVCDVAVGEGGYRMAWVGYAESDAARTVRPVAHSGEELGYLGASRITWDDSPSGNGPAGRSIRSGAPVAVEDLAADHLFAPWREAAVARGYRSCCAVPLRIGGEVAGALLFYAAEAYAFDADEVALLSEIGADLAFGIAAQRDRRALEAQRADLLLFREIMERSADAIFLIDDETGRFIDFNEAACRQLGYTPEEMRRLGPADIVPRFAEAGWPAASAELARGAAPVRTSQHRRKDGSLVPVEVSRTMLTAGGRRLALAVARDISERVRAETEHEKLEQQLRRAQRMESIGRLAGGIAHDFNNLLTVINANADLVASELPHDSPSAADVLQIRTAGSRAATLTRQLLAFSRQSVMKREVIDLSAVVTGFLGMLRRVIGEDIHVEAKLATQDCPVYADPGQMEQVLMNLCVNARDAMPRGGTLTLATRRVDVDEAFARTHETMKPGPHVLVEIADTGEGMTAEVQSHIFEPFFTTKDPGKGTGLGLATVYGIVKQTGGSIWVESEVGRGTTFRIYFPVHRGSGEHPSVPAEPTAPSRGHETILVVEDDAPIRLVARRMLERAGYTVHTAATAQDALDHLAGADARVHLVITDLVMPGMSGIELARRLEQEHPDIGILLTSGYSAEVLALERQEGAKFPLIPKPYAVADLLAAVRQVLDTPR